MLTKPLDMYAHDSAPSSSSVLLDTKTQENKAHISSIPMKNTFHMKVSAHTTKVVGFLFQRKKQASAAAVSHMNEKSSLRKTQNNQKTKNTPSTVSFQSKAHALQEASVAKTVSIKSKNAHKDTHDSLVSKNNALFAEDMQDIPLLAKCISFIMKKGHKAKAATTMNTVLRMLQDLSPQKKEVVHALDMIHVAINNVKPSFELRKARFGGRTQFIPATLPVHKQENQALRALVQTARMKHKKASHTNKHHDMYTFAYFLAQEIYDAYKHQGAACQAKHGTHKQAEHNRNHVRRRWW
jgi:ribosomal protein S7